MTEKWEVVKQPFEREIVRTVEYGVFAKNGKELVANVTSRKDARLISALPVMLEALKIAKSYLLNASYSYGMATEWNEAVAAVEAAIKATKGK